MGVPGINGGKGRWRMKKKTRQTLFALLCCVLFVLAVFLVFSSQQKRLAGEFEALVLDNLDSYTQSQRRQAKGMVSNMASLLKSVRVMIDTSGLPPDRPWLDSYLEELSSYNPHFDVDYVDRETLWRGTQRADAEKWDQEIYQRLLEGKSAISNVRFSERLNGYFFAVAEPIMEDGEMVGALRSRMDAALLTHSTTEPTMFQKISSLIVTGDGVIQYTNNQKKYDTDGNLLTTLDAGPLEEESTAEFRRAFEAGGAFNCRLRGKGNLYFAAVSEVGFNDWRIVNFVRSPDVLLRTETILNSVILSGIILICLTALAGCVLGGMMLRQKRRLDMEQRRYMALAQFSDTILFEYDIERDIAEFTSNACRSLSLEALTIRNVTAVNRQAPLLHPDDRETMLRAFRSPDRREDELFYGEARLKSENGEYRWFGCQYKLILNTAGLPAKIIGKLVDIDDQRSREQGLLERAQKDELTKTYNKSGERIINDLLRQEPKGLFFMIDLDDFKRINDTRGHTAGDAYLTKVGEALREIVRADDIVARVGGDEFVVFIPGLADEGLAEDKAGMILKKISSIDIGGIGPGGAAEGTLSASIGVAISPRDGAAYFELYEAADQAMYSVKRQAKGDYAVYRD